MPRVPTGQQSSAFDHSILVVPRPRRVLGAFFDPAALAAWWRGRVRSRPRGRSASTRSNGVPSREADAILGRLGGVFYGIVMEYKAGRELFVADAWWIPPDGDPIGPMSLAGELLGGRLCLPAARPAVRVRRDPALPPLLQRDRPRLAHLVAALKEYAEKTHPRSESTAWPTVRASSDPLHVDEVRVEPAHVGADVDEHDHRHRPQDAAVEQERARAARPPAPRSINGATPQ